MSKWLFEECNTFIEIAGAIAFYHFRSGIHPGILKMWGHLRKYALYFLHYRPGQHTTAQIRLAQREIFQFGEYAEANLNASMLTCLVHRCFAHIPAQVLATLPGAFLREDFGERVVRWTKKFIKGHSTVRAAGASANVCLTQMGLRIHLNKHPGVDGPLNCIRRRPPVRPLDDGDDYGTALHKLTPAHTGEDHDEVKFCMCRSWLACFKCSFDLDSYCLIFCRYWVDCRSRNLRKFYMEWRLRLQDNLIQFVALLP